MHLNDTKTTTGFSNFPAVLLRRFRPELVQATVPALSREELRRIVRDMVD